VIPLKLTTLSKIVAWPPFPSKKALRVSPAETFSAVADVVVSLSVMSSVKTPELTVVSVRV